MSRLLPLCLLALWACGTQATTNLEGTDATPVADTGISTQQDAIAALSDAEPPDTGVVVDDAGNPIVDDAGNPIIADTGVTPADAEPHDNGSPIVEDGGSRDAASSADAASTPDAGACMVDRDCGRGGGITSFCDPAQAACVECYQNMQCRTGQVCDTLNGNVCRIECFRGGRCPPGQTCDMATNTCAGCLQTSDCDADEVCDVARRECVECLTGADCARRVGVPICDAASNTCVGCASDRDCPGGVCDLGLDTCVTSSTGRGLCEACDDDGQCGGPNDHCIGTVSGAGFIDRTCAIDCANLTCPAGFDCVGVRGNTAQQCRPRYPMQNPTCTAFNHVGDACPFSANEPDPGCGIANRQDALCILAPGGASGVCTIGCETSATCPMGFTCTGAQPGQTGVCL